MNSREAISARKWVPPFLTHVSVSCRKSVRTAPIRSGLSHIQSTQLRIWVLVADATLERAHRLLWSDCLGANYVGDLEVECDVLPKDPSAAITIMVRWGTGLTGCCWSPSQPARPRPCWPRTTTSSSSRKWLWRGRSRQNASVAKTIWGRDESFELGDGGGRERERAKSALCRRRVSREVSRNSVGGAVAGAGSVFRCC